MLLTGGSAEKLLTLQFSAGDIWVLLAALFFAIYNTLVKKKPAALSPLSFLFASFVTGTILLLPFFLYEIQNSTPVTWTPGLYGVIVYLGAGTSVIAYLCWNLAIGKLGAARTALFGNLIPLFSIIEAVIFLNEAISIIHLFSGLLIVAGLVLANIKQSPPALLKTKQVINVN
jgi:drug/metabolite transporter (DMT)-like permease